MLPLDVAQTWTRLLAIAAGAPAATGAPGPGTLFGKEPALGRAGPWLGLLDVQGLRREEQHAIEAWLANRAVNLLLVRHLLVARPFEDAPSLELLPGAQALVPAGWQRSPQPILLLSPAGRARPQRKREYIDALLKLRVPLTSAGSDLWAVRDYDPSLLAAIAALSEPAARLAFRNELDPSQRRLFDNQLPLAEALTLDDLVGARDEESALRLDAANLRSLKPAAHPLAVFAAVERAHNRDRAPAEQSFYSGRTIEARSTGRGHPEPRRPLSTEFAALAEPLAYLPDELQRLSEAADLLDRA
jgi:hypothetical protein